MMDLIAGLKANIAAGQDAFVPTVGEGLLVGVRLAFVVGYVPSANDPPASVVTLEYDDGTREALPLSDLRGYALARVEWRPKGNVSPVFLDMVWSVAGVRPIPAPIRAAYVARAVSRAPTQDDSTTARGWLAALLRGLEPARV